MRAVLQRVRSARVTVGGEVTGEIERGLLVYLGVGEHDGLSEAAWLARKLAELRLFEAPGAPGFERSLLDLAAEAAGEGRAPPGVLVVSQFTLYASTRRGRRPSFTEAARPEAAAPLIEAFVRELEALGLRVAGGRFGAHMLVASENDGPVTILLDSADRARPRRG